MFTLDKLEMGESGRIKEVRCNSCISRRLMDLGIINGSVIVPVLKSPSGNPRAYEVRGSIIAIRNEDAMCIELIK